MVPPSLLRQFDRSGGLRPPERSGRQTTEILLPVCRVHEHVITPLNGLGRARLSPHPLTDVSVEHHLEELLPTGYVRSDLALLKHILLKGLKVRRALCDLKTNTLLP